MPVALAYVFSAVAAVAAILLIVVVELILTMVIYIYLNLFHIGTFGYLVRIARSVLDVLTGQLEYWMPTTANAAYATLVGELGPKSILLLLLGLLISAVIRTIARVIRPLVRRRPADSPQYS